MEKKYYSKFLTTFLLMLFISLLVGIITWIIRSGELPQWEHMGYPILGMFLFCLILTGIAIPFFPVTIRPEGLTTYTFWGTFSTIIWDDIVSTSTFNMLGFCYVTIRSKQNKTLFIPRFLGNYIGFRDQVAAWAGEQHPLTLALFAV